MNLKKPYRLHYALNMIKHFSYQRTDMWLSAICILLFSALPAAANLNGNTLFPKDDTTYLSPDEARQGELLIKQKSGKYKAMTLSGTDVNIQISGMLARTTVRQVFKNNDQNWVEGIYVFPLPDESSVHMLKMHVGKRIIKGEIKEKQQAKAIYQKARREGKKTTLVEQERPNMFTTSVANIGPGETVIVEIGYQEVVLYADSKFSIRFPMVVGPRYIPGSPSHDDDSTTMQLSANGWALDTDQVPDASRITPPVRNPVDGPTNPITMSINLISGIPLKSVHSPYHSIAVQQTTEDQYHISLNKKVFANRDFVLEWQPKKDSAPRAALFSENYEGHQYALLMLMPPERDLDNPHLSREIILVLDISGSMAGTSLIQAKNALSMAIARLSPNDHFNIIVFNNKARALFPVSLPGETTNINHAIQLVNKLQAGGGTNIDNALELALDGQSQHQLLRQVVFLTDGSVGNEENLFAMIQNKLGDTRLFTVGIGSAPNSYFMSRAAEFGQGTFTHIGKVTEVQEKMNSLFAKLDNQAMTDVNLKTGQENTEQYPQRIGDLYAGEPLLIAMKLDKMPKELLIKGTFHKQKRQYSLQPGKSANREGIARFWARKKIRSLMNTLIKTKDQELIRKQVLETALQHHLVSRYTSLVAVEQETSRPQTEGLDNKDVAVNLPHGWKHSTIFAGSVKTATPAGMYSIAGIFLLTCTMLLRLLTRQRNKQ